MNLHLTGHHVEITPAIRDYVTAKLERINRHFDHVIDVNVIMTVEKLDQKIEANVHLSGKDIHVQAHDGDMYAAIDGLIDKLDRQVIRAQGALRTRARHGHQAHPAGVGLESRPHEPGLAPAAAQPRPARPGREQQEAPVRADRAAVRELAPDPARARLRQPVRPREARLHRAGLRRGHSRTGASRRSRSRCARSCAPPQPIAFESPDGAAGEPRVRDARARARHRDAPGAPLGARADVQRPRACAKRSRRPTTSRRPTG